MICSRTSQYAVRGPARLAQVPQGSYASVKSVAAAEDIPLNCLQNQCFWLPIRQPELLAAAAA